MPTVTVSEDVLRELIDERLSKIEVCVNSIEYCTGVVSEMKYHHDEVLPRFVLPVKTSTEDLKKEISTLRALLDNTATNVDETKSDW